MATPGDGSVESDVLSSEGVGRRVVLGATQRAGGFAAVNLMTALTAVLLLRYLGVEDFGRYGTVMALLAIVQGVSDAGLTMTGSRELAVQPSDAARRDLLGHLVALRIVLTAGGMVLAAAFALAVGYPAVMVEGTALAGSGIFILCVQGAFLLPLAVSLDNWTLALNDVLRQVVLVACFIALVILGASLLPFFAAQLVAALFVLAMTPVLLRGHGLVRPRWSGKQLRALTAATVPLAAATILNIVYFRLLIVLISLLDNSARDVGYFVTSARIMEVLLNLPVMLVAVVLPVLSVSARDNADRLQYATGRMTEVMCLLGTLLAVVLASGARPILLVLGGRQYLGAAVVLQIQCLALVTMFVTAAWTTTLVGMGRTRSLSIATAVGVIAVAAIGTPLILLDGARGAAIAAVAADIVLCGTVLVFLCSAGAGRHIAVGPLLRIGLSALPAAVIAVFHPLPSAAGCALATALFIGLVLAQRIVPSEILDVIRQVPALLARMRNPLAP